MIVLTSSSIPSRFRYLPQFYAELAKQKTRPDKVELWLARNYRRFPGEVPSLPELPDWVDVNWIEDDLGPATKVLPAARKWRGSMAELVFCDDDRLYDRDWLGRFRSSRLAFPDMALIEAGMTLEQLGFKRMDPPPGEMVVDTPKSAKRAYRRKRILSLGMWRKPRDSFLSPGFVDILEGYGGVCVHPDWFQEEDFEIPPVLWTVDDVWLSGCLTRRGIKIHSNIGAKRVISLKSSHNASPLTKHVEDGVGRMEANRQCVQYFQETYGIWL